MQLNASARAWSQPDIGQHFYNRIVDGRSVFDGCVPLAKAIGVVETDGDGKVTMSPNLTGPLVNETYFSNKMLDMILTAAKADDMFYEIFCAEHISYDVIYHYIQVDLAAFPLRYSNFRQLLVSFDFLYPHPDKNIRKFIIRPKHKRLFDTRLMPEIRKRKIGLDELQQTLERKQQYGQQAEEFVWNIERTRLALHPRIGRVEIISGYDVGAGFDLVSFENLESIEHDRFIEVKSYSGKLAFHWSRNEIDVARIKGDKYLLCLVDRDRMYEKSYTPRFLRNPYALIIENPKAWNKRIEDYLITEA